MSWEARIARARHLADRYPAAAEILAFYARLAEYQRSLAVRRASATSRLSPGALRDFRLEPKTSGVADDVLEEIPSFVTWLGGAAPPGLATAVAELDPGDRPAWRAVLDRYLAARDEEAASPVQVFIVEALLQPLAEQLTREGGPQPQRPAPPTDTDPGRCPCCGGLPVVGALREEGEGAKRSLVCGLCLTEWPYFRLLCPACGERRFEQLPVFTSDEVPGARIEACDTCHRYLKTVDLTRDGHAIPCVDDLASVSLDLWARDQGYSRVRSNLLLP